MGRRHAQPYANIASRRLAVKRKPLWRVSIATSAEAEDAVAAMLTDALGQPATSYTDLKTGRTVVTAYLPKQPPASGRWRTDLQERLERVRACGLNPGPARITQGWVRWQHWAESWKRHFKPLVIASTLIVKPSWSHVRPRKGQVVVVLDPGLSFGTGQHPTTAFCLLEIVKHRLRGQSQSLLDIGTGSGILAIAAAKLGYDSVQAFDNDPDAVRVACANAHENGVAGKIRFARKNLACLSLQPTRKHSVVCANLISNLLLAERQRVVAQLQPGGLLVLAGILKEEFSEIQAAYEASGFRLIASRTQREWSSGAFESQPGRTCAIV
jgi:ribosomal protein L11 methyltransferase